MEKLRQFYHKLPHFLQVPIDKVASVYRKFMALSWKQKTALITLVLLLFMVVIPLLTYAYYARDIRDPERLMNRKNTGVTLVDRNGETFYSFFQARSQDGYAEFDDIPEHVREALVATEDKQFYEHGGFSLRSIVAASYANLTGGDLKRYGGSTITQQLVKNSLLTTDKSYIRKYQELFLSIAVDRQYNKDKILEMYLNSVYFGEGAFGIDDAARTYFNKTPKELTLEEGSMLIGLLPAPSAYSPISGDKELAKERQQVVLSAMQEEGYITAKKYDVAIKTKVTYDYQDQNINSDAPHFALMVLDQLEAEYGEEEIARSGFRVKTTLDLAMQRKAQEAVKNQVDRISYANANNGSFLAMDPNNGEVRALVGSKDWANEEFGKVNMVTTPRQPGSSFKPIYYSEALDEEIITPATIIRDEPTDFGGGYEPENYDFRYRGDITVRDALATSLNIPAVKVMQQVGVSEAIEAAQRLGIESISDDTDYGLSLALGTGEVKLLEMTNAYAAFANQGEQFEPTLVTEIEDKYGRVNYTHEARSKSVISPEASFLISSILSDEQARAPTFGSRFSIGRPFAVKTGTTQDSRDAWTMGYMPGIAMGAWVGNNDNEKMNGIGGSSGAGPIIVEMAQYYAQDNSSEEFERPNTVIEADVCQGTEKIADQPFEGTFTEYFIGGTLFDDRCFAPQEDEEDENENDNENNEDEEDDSEANQAPMVSIGAEPESGEAPLEVQFSSEASDEDGTVLSYSWNFGDGTTSSTEPSPIHTYATPGTYTATLTITDNDGATATDSVTIEVSDPETDDEDPPGPGPIPGAGE